MAEVILVDVFTCNGTGGNPCPVVVNAEGMSDREMQDIAAHYGHESGFVFPSTDGAHDFQFRFFVPNHEMEMCGHATIGALSLLAMKGRLPSESVRLTTLSGSISGFVGRTSGPLPYVEVTQPAGRLDRLNDAEIGCVMAALGLGLQDLADRPLYNASTSRVKTLIPIKNAARLNAIQIDTTEVRTACERIGSTGLYPYSVLDVEERQFEARQFPRSSGYPEDAATGIAAAALAFGLLADGLFDGDSPVRIFQGRAMGRLSEIQVGIEFNGNEAVGCRIGGAVSLANH